MLVMASATSAGYIRLYIDSAQKYKLCSVLTLTAPGPVNMNKRCFSCVTETFLCACVCALIPCSNSCICLLFLLCFLMYSMVSNVWYIGDMT